MNIMKKPGYALATVLVLMGVSLFGIGALVSTTSLEAKISRSQIEGTTAYYAADAGMADAIWRLNNNTTYADALANGTLNVTYTATNAPQNGQGFTVTMVTTSQGKGYATVTVDATSNNGTFIARREVKSSVFAGPPTAQVVTGTNAVMAGGNFSITGSGDVNITNGDIATNGNAGFTSTNVNMSANWVRAVGNYSATSSNVSVAGIAAANFPPAGTTSTIPGISFSYYQTNNSVSYTASQFTTLIKRANANITFPGPITYVNGSVGLTASIARNKNITINGLLVINGNFSMSTGISNLVMNVNDPGNGLSGIVVSGNSVISSGDLNIDGLVYTAGNMSISSVSNLTINGALVSPYNIAISPGGNVTINYVSSRPTTVFNNGNVTTAQALQVLHWEEDY